MHKSEIFVRWKSEATSLVTTIEKLYIANKNLSVDSVVFPNFNRSIGVLYN